MAENGSGPGIDQDLRRTVIDVSPVPQRREPSDASWKFLMEQAIRGNGQFPQAFFSQGVRLAHGMVGQARAERIPLITFLEASPPASIIHTELAKAREKFHGAFNVTTVPNRTVSLEEQYEHVWEGDQQSASNILYGYAAVLYEARGIDPDTILNETMLQGVQDDPLFYDLLGYTVEGLNAEKVKKFAKAYKERIAAFTNKYAPFTFRNIPTGYYGDQTELMALLAGGLSNSIYEVKDTVVQRLQQEHPEERKLIDILAEADWEDIYGRQPVTLIHPLKDPDQQLPTHTT